MNIMSTIAKFADASTGRSLMMMATDMCCRRMLCAC